jgi:aquaporin Z
MPEVRKAGKKKYIMENNGQSFPWRSFWAELIGTALLLMVGLSIVILMFGTGSPLAEWIPNLKLRQSITGFLFGGTGALIAISVIGKESGAHINPVVTMAFWLFRKMDARKALGYVVAQLTGAVIGTLPLLLWGQLGRSISFGTTAPGTGYSVQDALLGEVATTFTMVTLLILFLGFRQIRPYTPALFPFLYAIMVPLEADISGISTNPARSFGPSVVSGQWDAWWIYWAGPIAGALLACILCSRMATRITAAKLYYFDSDEDRLARRTALADKEGKVKANY